LAPEYVKAAKKLEELNSATKLAKVDSTEETELSEQHEVRGYPTLKFFRNGKAIDYTGGRTADEIVNWLEKKTGPAAKTISSSEEVKKFIEEHDVVVVGFFKVCIWQSIVSHVRCSPCANCQIDSCSMYYVSVSMHMWE